MSRDSVLKSLTKDLKNCKIISNVNVPVVTMNDIITNRKLCEKNLCNNYGISWVCPPNCESGESCIEKLSKYSSADVLSVRYENLDFKNVKQIHEIMADFQNLCRDIMIECRKEGFDVLALADGKCNICKKCGVVDKIPCRHPDMVVAPISANGIDMKKYLNSIGEDFVFEKDAATLYGIFLFK